MVQTSTNKTASYESPQALLSTEQMYQADALAVDTGLSSIDLMENAGHAIVREMVARLEPGPVAILCGPGNNGGDGFVVARLLSEGGWPVRLGLLGEKNALKDDAAIMAARWTKETEQLSPDIIEEAAYIVDALFGAGLSRELSADLSTLILAVNDGPATVIAVDVPTGVQGTNGQIAGHAVQADLSITFFRKKPGHVLLPGRLRCGEVVVADIGIPDRVLDTIEPNQWENTPDLWLKAYPWPQIDAHKYSRGHAVSVSGAMSQGGASRLAARAALRIGAGLVTVASPTGAVMAHAAQLNAIMVQGFDDLTDVLVDERKNSFVLGPGNGVGEKTRENVLRALQAGRACVLDADALTSFQDDPETLFGAITANSVLTPHMGEFNRLFPDATGLPSKLEQAREAAKVSGGVVVLKGPDTVIASPDGRAAINTNAPPTLATAGSGDVLAGMVGGLLAQSMPAFEAACAAVWLHGEAAAAFGPGLIAEDISEALPFVLRKLQ